MRVKQKARLSLLIASLNILVMAFLLFFGSPTASAAIGINPQLSFEGKLVNLNGTNITNGTYNMQFKIYQDGTNMGVGSTLKWTENRLVGGSGGVTLVDGTFQVNLGSVTAFGSSVDWNQDTLWLSMQIGNTASCTITTTFQTDCAGDGEMTPYIRLTAVPYANNSAMLSGLVAGNFVQLAQGVQTDSSTTAASIAINKTGTTANILTLQKGGVNVLLIDNGGLVTLQPAANLTAGQTHISQTLTNGSSTGGTVNGYNQTITVSNTSSASTTNGINISLTDSTALGNTNKGIIISISGSNINQVSYGVDATVGRGYGITGTSSMSGANAGVGVQGIASTTGALGSTTSGGIIGRNSGIGGGTSNYVAVKGISNQTSVSAGAYNSVGIYGEARTGVSEASAYGGYFIFNPGHLGIGAALYASNSSSTANILQLQDNTTNVLSIADEGLITLQPAANLTAGQTHITQSLTNASSTGGIVNGYSQTITVSNTTSVSTTNGLNITVADSTALANINTGVKIAFSGSNTSAVQIGLDADSTRGIGVRGSSAGISATSVSCGTNLGGTGVGVCGTYIGNNNVGAGVAGTTNANSTNATQIAGTGVWGYNYATGAAGNFFKGVVGLSDNLTGSSGAYTSIGVTGSSKALLGATAYGGYFTLLSTSTATAGAALYASNSTVATNILQVQDNTSDVLLVADGGATTLSPVGDVTGLTVKQTSDVTTPTRNIFQVQSSNGAINYLSLNLASSVPHLKVYGAGGTSYADIYYDDATTTAYFGASTGTAVLGSGTGTVTINAGAAASFTITGNAASSITTTAGALTITSNAAATWSTAAGNLILQGGSGTVSLGTSTNLTASGALTVASAAATALTLTGNAASTISTSAGDLILQGGSGRVSLGTSGTFTASGALVIKPGASSATAIQLQSSTSVNYLTLDSTNLHLQLGSSITDATAILLVVDSYNNATDPTGANGAMYYNTALNKFRCYENGAWANCIGGPIPLEESLTIMTPPNALAAWTNQPSALTELFGTTRHRAFYNMTNATQARLIVNVETASAAAGAQLCIQYSTDGTTWVYLDGGTGPCVATTAAGTIVGAWTNIAVGGKNDYRLRIAGTTTSASTGDPAFGTIYIQFK